MASGVPGTGDDRAYFRSEEQVRTEFKVASYGIWIALAGLVGTRWDDEVLVRMTASHLVRDLGDLAKLRCLPEGRPASAAHVLEDLHTDVLTDGKAPATVVERQLVRGRAGTARNQRTPAEVTDLIEAFLQCYAADYERGELTWVDELYALAAPGAPAASWRLEVPQTYQTDEDASVVLRIPVAALEAAGLMPGDPLILEPRANGLWIGRGARL